MPDTPTLCPPAARTGRRRRLWELPAAAHDLLLALSFDTETLRQETARAIGRLHKARCTVGGADVDVLYSIVNDLGRRNAVSEAFQRRLEAAHAATVRRWATLREAAALRQAWSEALQGQALAPSLWALLTHPGSPDLEAGALLDARAWVFRHARSALAARAATQAQSACTTALAAEVASLRKRLAAQQTTSQALLDDARQDAARLRGEVQRWRAACESHPPAAASGRPAPVATAPGLGVPPRPAASTVAVAQVVPAAAPAPQACVSPPPTPGNAPPAATEPAPAAVHGKQVLCVGGMQHAVARYRSHVERLGGRFEHHDGGVEEGLQRLDGRLARADLVVCQAGCVNHEAYRRIKRYCARAGKPCLFLDRPSLARFERALGAAGPHEAARA
ncbi:MAG: DUF2325 domain-containing protein [Rubrivivax sp.]|nr:DUF2325 domain-containing protein [Rubrivivax sp.]